MAATESSHPLTQSDGPMTGWNMAAFSAELMEKAEGGSAEPLLSNSYDDAAAILAAFFVQASSKISILSDQLRSRTYAAPMVVEAARCFLRQPSARLNILIENPDAFIGCSKASFVELLYDFRKNIDIRCVRDKVVQSYKYNFWIFDQRGYRFEHDRESPIAITSFNDPVTANRLLDIFNTLWENGSTEFDVERVLRDRGFPPKA